MNWRARLGLDTERNPFLRLSEADRLKMGVRMVWLAVGAGVFFCVLKLLGWPTR